MQRCLPHVEDTSSLMWNLCGATSPLAETIVLYAELVRRHFKHEEPHSPHACKEVAPHELHMQRVHGSPHAASEKLPSLHELQVHVESGSPRAWAVY